MNVSRLLLDSNSGSECELAVSVLSLLSVLCTSEPVKIMGILSRAVISVSVSVKRCTNCLSTHAFQCFDALGLVAGRASGP